MKNIVILGSTGSIGTNGIEVAKKLGYSVQALSCDRNVELLERQARELLPRYVCAADERCYKNLKLSLADTNITVMSGKTGLEEISSLDSADIFLHGIVGIAGLLPAVAAAKTGKTLAIANKESLVTAGDIILPLARLNSTKIIPVDSEHSAIFQCIDNAVNGISKIILTASGGPFFGKSKEELASVTAEEALSHPNWSMGRKITVDSATLMNKGLELIEAVRFFGVSPSQVEVVVHRESVVHSAVEFSDGAVIAQMSPPDMKLPIQYALTYPLRLPCDARRLSLERYGSLTFYAPDEEAFPCLPACKRAAEKGFLAPTAANAANEAAVSMFLNGRIPFSSIADVVSRAVDDENTKCGVTLETIYECDKNVRELVRGWLSY